MKSLYKYHGQIESRHCHGKTLGPHEIYDSGYKGGQEQVKNHEGLYWNWMEL